MITKIKFKNFKCYKELVEIKLNQLTLFSGRNSAGKSTIAQVLILLNQSINYFNDLRVSNIPYLKLNTKDLVLGSPDEILNDKKQPLYIGFQFDSNNELEFEFTPAINIGEENSSTKLYLSHFICKNNQNKLFFEADLQDNGWTINSQYFLLFEDFEFAHGFEQFMIEKTNLKDSEYMNPNVCFENIDNLVFSSFIPKKFTISYETLKKTILPDYLSENFIEELFDNLKNKQKIEIPNEISLMISSQSIKSFYNDLNSIYNLANIQAFRGVPERLYTNDTEQNPLYIIYQNQKKTVKYHYNLDKNRSENTTLLKAFKYWIIDIFKLCDELNLKNVINDFASTVTLTNNKKEIVINNVGFGISQIIPLIAKCLTSDSGIIVIDEPESHLHPNMQTQIGEFLLNMAMLGKQIIVETHSEHIINICTLYNLKYKKLKGKTLSYWVDNTLENESNFISEIEYNEYGYPTNAPLGFYDETLKVINELNEIRQKKILGE